MTKCIRCKEETAGFMPVCDECRNRMLGKIISAPRMISESFFDELPLMQLFKVKDKDDSIKDPDFKWFDPYKSRFDDPEVFKQEYLGSPISPGGLIPIIDNPENSSLREEMDRVQQEVSERMARERERELMESLPTRTIRSRQPKFVIPDYMSKEFELLPQNVKELLSKHYITAYGEVSEYLLEQERSDTHAEHLVTKEMFKALVHKLIESKNVTITEAESPRHRHVRKEITTFVFPEKVWLDILSEVFYAGVDYAHEQNKEEQKDD